MFSRALNPSDPIRFMENEKLYTPYGKEIMKTLFEAERHNIQIRKSSDQLPFRPALVELMKQYSKYSSFSSATFHLGVYFLDVYMDSYILSEFKEHQRLIALVCLIMAAKSEEVDDTIPSIKDLVHIVDVSQDLGVNLRDKDDLDPKTVTKAYKSFAGMYCQLEFLIFETLEFNCCRPTVLSFLNVFENICVTEKDFNSFDPESDDAPPSLLDLSLASKELMKQFQKIVLDVEFFNILPSLIAAAIVGSVRKVLNIKEYWNQDLFKLTSYPVEEVRPLIIMLIEKHKDTIIGYSHVESIEDVEIKDSGYLSCQSSPASPDQEDVYKPTRKKRKLGDLPGIIYEIR